MKITLIINPRANHGQAERLIAKIISMISKHVDSIVATAKRPRHFENYRPLLSGAPGSNALR